MEPTERTYRVTTDRLGSREYDETELVWLWKTAQLPPGAEYRAGGGEWRPVEELIEPIIAANQRAVEIAVQAAKDKGMPKPRPRRWRRVLAVSICLAILVVLIVRTAVTVLRHGTEDQVSDREAVHRENTVRTEEAIAAHQVFPGMTAEQVRRSWGPPASLQPARPGQSRDDPGRRETWTYPGYRIEFQGGIAIRLDALP